MVGFRMSVAFQMELSYRVVVDAAEIDLGILAFAFLAEGDRAAAGMVDGDDFLALIHPGVEYGSGRAGFGYRGFGFHKSIL